MASAIVRIHAHCDCGSDLEIHTTDTSNALVHVVRERGWNFCVIHKIAICAECKRRCCDCLASFCPECLMTQCLDSSLFLCEICVEKRYIEDEATAEWDAPSDYESL